MRTRGQLVTAVLIVIASGCLSVVLGQEKKGGPTRPTRHFPVAEPRDIAERRAKAFHDIYAGDAEIGALTDAIKEYKRGIESRGPERPGRPLPINFPSRDRSVRLRVLTQGQPTRTFPGSTFRSMTTRAPVSGTNWVNLGPTNFAGRVSSLAVDPTNSSVI